MAIAQAEYIWLDGVRPTQTLRSKTRVITSGEDVSLSDFPDWGFDGSSTQQAPGDNSDCVLKPVNFVDDPIRGYGNYLVLCEVFDSKGNPHETNHRAQLRTILDAGADKSEATFGFEQEYTFLKGTKPLGWPENGYPSPQGPFYCGVGAERVDGRQIVEDHTQACIDAGLLIFGVNAEVMLGQWEFQIGYRGFEGDQNDPLTICDHVWFACWIMDRIAEDYEVKVSYENKPVQGDWNGAGCHTNFSTKDMRDPKSGPQTIERILDRMKSKHEKHINVYGNRNHERLTGDHETCAITKFKAGVSDRGASIRVPMSTDEKGYGYLEDRRPGANSDPYLVAARILTTICEVDEKLFTFTR